MAQIIYSNVFKSRPSVCTVRVHVRIRICVVYNARHIYTVATLIVIRTLISAVYEEESARHRSFGAAREKYAFIPEAICIG